MTDSTCMTNHMMAVKTRALKAWDAMSKKKGFTAEEYLSGITMIEDDFHGRK